MRNYNQLKPFSGLVENLLNNQHVNRYFDDAFRDNWIKTPAVNIKETDNAFLLEAFAPGAEKEDFKMSVNDKTLTISFESKEETKQENEKWLRSEYKLGSFKRSFSIGDLVDVEKINAKYENGVLKIELPKKEAAIITKKDIEIA